MAALAAPATPILPIPMRLRAGAALVSLATALVILGATMVPFFSSVWIDFAQARAGSAALTGYSPDEVHSATGSLVHDLLFGGAFDARVAGATVLHPAEQSHLVDVRGVLDGFAIAVLLSIVGLVLAAWLSRSSAARAAVWAAVRRGAAWLAILLVVLGVFAVSAFDVAFELFHRILFPGGNFDFDPRTEKLVQLFPEQLWSETALAYGAAAITISIVVAWYAGRRLGAAGGPG